MNDTKLTPKQAALVDRVRRNPGKTFAAYDTTKRKLEAMCGRDGPLRKVKRKRWGMPTRFAAKENGDG